MTSTEPSGRGNEEFWRDFLTRGHSKERVGRRLFKLIPRTPRCRLCAAPFAGVGAPLMRVIGKRPSDNDFRRLIDRFYDTASTVVFDHDGIVGKFVGDELVAMFFPLLTGERHAAGAIDAARALFAAVGHADPAGPRLPLGAGVHTGIAWVGAVGSGTRTELTALGDAVNTTARLASAAAPGEILVTAETAMAAGLDGDLDRTWLELKGKQQPTEVVTVAVGRPVD